MARLQKEIQPAVQVETQLIETCLPYLSRLIDEYPGVIEFNTGAGLIFFDLFDHLPSISGYEREKSGLCHLIERYAYPLAARLFAEAVKFTLTLSANPLGPPLYKDVLTSFTAFDAKDGLLRHGFLSPHQKTPDYDDLEITSGLTVECEPLNFPYHKLKGGGVRRQHHYQRDNPRPQASNLLIRNNPNRLSSRSETRGDRQPPTSLYALRSRSSGPRWNTEEKLYPSMGHTFKQEIMPRVSSMNGTSHLPNFIRLLAVRPNLQSYEVSQLSNKRSDGSKDRVKTSVARLERASEFMTRPDVKYETRLVSPSAISLQKSGNVDKLSRSASDPGTVPGWFRV